MRDVTAGPSARVPVWPFRLILVGGGRVGTAVAELLRRRGHVIAGVASRTPESTERAARALRTTTFSVDDASLPPADVVLLAVPDHAISDLATRIAPAAPDASVFWHVSGSLGLKPLRAAIER